MAVYVRQLNALLLALGYNGRPVSARDFNTHRGFAHIGGIIRWLLDCCCTSSVALPKNQLLLHWEREISDNVESRVAFTCEAAALVARHAGLPMSECDVTPDALLPAAPALYQLVALSRALLQLGRDVMWRQQHSKSAAAIDRKDNQYRQRETQEPCVAANLGVSRAVAPAVGRREIEIVAAAVSGEESAGPPVAAPPAASGDDADFGSHLVSKEHQQLLSRVEDLKIARLSAAQLTRAGANIRRALERHNSSSRQHYFKCLTVFLDQLGLYLDTSTAGQHAAIEAALEKQLQKDKLELKKAQIQCDEIQRDVRSTAATLQKAMQESERVEKRLESVLDLKSPFQKEYDKLMIELHSTHVTYVTCVRNARFLEQQADKLRLEDQQLQRAQQRQLQHVQEKLREDAAQLLRAFDADDSDIEDEVFCVNDTSEAEHEAELREQTEKTTKGRDQEREAIREREALAGSAVFQDYGHFLKRQDRNQHSRERTGQQQPISCKKRQECTPEEEDADYSDCMQRRGVPGVPQQSDTSPRSRQQEDMLLRKYSGAFVTPLHLRGALPKNVCNEAGYLSSRHEKQRHSVERRTDDCEGSCFSSRSAAAHLRRCNSAAAAAPRSTLMFTRVSASLSEASTSDRTSRGSFEEGRVCSKSSNSTRRTDCSQDTSQRAASRSCGEAHAELMPYQTLGERRLFIKAEEDGNEADDFEARLRSDFLSPEERRQQQQRSRLQALQDLFF